MVPWIVQSHLDGTKRLGFIAMFFVELGHGTARQLIDLKAPCNAAEIIWVDKSRVRRIDGTEAGVESLNTQFLRLFFRSPPPKNVAPSAS